jgi:hypothetical protein
MKAGPNDPCSSDEAGFMDENLPIYDVLLAGEAPMAPIKVENMAPSVGPKISLVRLGDIGGDVTCENVRDAPYPR